MAEGNPGTGSDRGAFIWYELAVPDPALVRDFYHQVAGWTIDPAGEDHDGAEYRMIRRADGGFAGGVLTLTAQMSSAGMRPMWIGYIHHPNVDAAARAIVDAGGQCFMGPLDMAGVGRMAMLADPQGAAIYLLAPTPPEGDPDAQSDVFGYMEPGRFTWNELMTTDPVAALDLYGDLFGWTQEGSMPMSDLGEYQFIQHGSTPIGAVMPLVPQVERSCWNFYIATDDIDRAAAAVLAHGGSLMGEIQEVPGGSYVLNAIDPAGAPIGLVGPRKEQDA
ncbi:VOC family protein [Croceibacterium ferulae]|uniref:VOC family protein n=1 Tax=Croceibacterium ferulae TaxID=1854641 RepID=UPI000EAEA0ED|nr:VOC family protein [Croceibacterium ferulae]